MDIWHGYSIRHGRFVRYVFLVAALLPWPIVLLLTMVQEWILALGTLTVGVFAACNYRQMRRFTTTMERWVNREHIEDVV